MILNLIRYNHDLKSTQGLLRVNGGFECHTLEDEERCEKVHGETRIPEGSYQVKFREDITALTHAYRSRYDWFEWHLMLQNVPGFEWVYIHVGNTEIDTEGCLLVGDVSENDPGNRSAVIGKSRQAFERVYQLISAALKSGEEVWMTIESI